MEAISSVWNSLTSLIYPEIEENKNYNVVSFKSVYKIVCYSSEFFVSEGVFD